MDNLTNYSTLFLLRKSNISLFIYLIINKTVYNKTFSMNIIFFNIWIILITEYDNIETKMIILPKNFTKNNYYCSIQILIKVKIINTWHKYFWNLSTFINNITLNHIKKRLDNSNRLIYYLASLTALTSRITLTLMFPGYCIVSSILFLTSLAIL